MQVKQLLSDALPLIEKIPSDFYQENILEHLGRLIGRTREQLNNRVKTPKQQHAIERKFKITPRAVIEFYCSIQISRQALLICQNLLK